MIAEAFLLCVLPRLDGSPDHRRPAIFYGVQAEEAARVNATFHAPALVRRVALPLGYVPMPVPGLPRPLALVAVLSPRCVEDAPPKPSASSTSP